MVDRDLASIGPLDETSKVREQQIVVELDTLIPVLEDLEASRSKLGGFIRQLDTYTRRIFGQTRSRVEARFRKYCEILFEGGDARLAPAESAGERRDLFDSGTPGVEVRVRLPRKPELHGTFLSGGERSLAGIALVLVLVLVLVLALAAGGRFPASCSFWTRSMPRSPKGMRRVWPCCSGNSRNSSRSCA